MDTRREPTTPPESKDAVNILVIDVDSTAIFTCTRNADGSFTPNPRQDSLSQTLIDHAKKGDYQGFYVCTHRCFDLTYEATLSERVQRTYSQNGAAFQPENLLLISVIRHFAEATGLPFIAASTYDDHFVECSSEADRCGRAYETIIKPYEEKLLAVNQSFMKARKIAAYRDVTFHVPETMYKLGAKNDEIKATKNKQYLSIVSHAEKRFPGKKIHLHAADDVFEICDAALSISSACLGRVKISVYYHHPFVQVDMRYLGCVFGMDYVKDTQPVQLSTSRIQAHLQLPPAKLADEKAPAPDNEVTIVTIHADSLADEEDARNRDLIRLSC